MDYTGTIIEESLEDKGVLSSLVILGTRIGKSQPNTPHVPKWTLHTIIIPETKADEYAQKFSQALDYSHCAWYADYRNDIYDYIIFKQKIFKLDRKNQEQYLEAIDYGLSLGIPKEQIRFLDHMIV